MLSIVDLMEAETIPLDLAAYFLAVICRGASFLVGAVPPRAGKTTVMGALLNFVPDGVELRTTDSLSAIEWAMHFERRRGCYVCPEIGEGHYFGYLWGEALRTYFDLFKFGHLLASTLHADTVASAEHQICGVNEVSPRLFQRVNLLVFLSIEGGWNGRRKVFEAWESAGHNDHVPVFEDGGLHLSRSLLVKPAAWEASRQVLAGLIRSGARTLQEVRRALVTPGVLDGLTAAAGAPARSKPAGS